MRHWLMAALPQPVTHGVEAAVVLAIVELKAGAIERRARLIEDITLERLSIGLLARTVKKTHQGIEQLRQASKLVDHHGDLLAVATGQAAPLQLVRGFHGRAGERKILFRIRVYRSGVHLSSPRAA